MSMHPWALQERLAALRLESMTATIDLSRPDQGLQGLCLGAADGWPIEARLLGIELPGHAAADEDLLLDCYTRGRELVAAYRPSAIWPVQADIIWHVGGPSQAASTLATIDVVISVRTELLDSRPEMAVVSMLPAMEVCRLLDGDRAQFASLPMSSMATESIEPHSGPSCLLFRSADSQFSYVEMSHPEDLRRDELVAAEGGMVQTRHRLFSEALEKGVILRARVRGAFVPRQGDQRIAATCFAAFAAEEPPLG